LELRAVKRKGYRESIVDVATNIGIDNDSLNRQSACAGWRGLRHPTDRKPENEKDDGNEGSMASRPRSFIVDRIVLAWFPFHSPRPQPAWNHGRRSKVNEWISVGIEEKLRRVGNYSFQFSLPGEPLVRDVRSVEPIERNGIE
jgi:hypothetical protein